MEMKCNDTSTGCNFDCRNCAVPKMEPEWCERCSSAAEEDGIEYEANFTHVTGTWTCDHCGGGV